MSEQQQEKSLAVKVAEMKAKIAAKQAEIAKLTQEKEARETTATKISTSNSTNASELLSSIKRPSPAPPTSSTSSTPTAQPISKHQKTFPYHSNPQHQELVQLSNSSYLPHPHHSHHPQHHGLYDTSFYDQQAAYFATAAAHQQGFGYGQPPAYFSPHLHQYHENHDENEDDIDMDDQDDTYSSQLHNNAPSTAKTSTLPSFKSKTLCQAWPSCRYNDTCRFFHPLVENIIISSFYPTMPIFSTLGPLQPSSTNQTQSLSNSLLNFIQSEMKTFSTNIPLPPPASQRLNKIYSPAPPPHHHSLLPALPLQFRSTTSTSTPLSIPIELSSPVSSQSSTTTRTQLLSSTLFQTQIQQASDHVPFIHFFLDVIKKCEQFKDLKQEHFLAALGLPTFPQIFSTIKSYLTLCPIPSTDSGNIASASQILDNNENLPIHCIQIPLHYPTSTLSLPIPSNDTSSLNTAIPNNPTCVDQSAIMYIFPAATATATDSSTLPSPQPSLPMYRIHIISSSFYQQLFPVSFQLITNSQYKTFFLATSPNTLFKPSLYSSYQQQQPSAAPNQPPVYEKQHLKQQQKLERNNKKNEKPTAAAIAASNPHPIRRIPLREDPKFKIYPINFVHGGSIVQKQLTQQQLQQGEEEISFLPSSTAPSASASRSNDQSFQLTDGLKAIQQYDPNIDLSLIPPQYSHLIPLIYKYDPTIFYTFDEIMKTRYGAQLALTQRMQQQQHQQGRRCEPSMFDKMRSMQFYAASTVKMPAGFFKPYNLTELNTNSATNAAVLENLIRTAQEADLFTDPTQYDSDCESSDDNNTDLDHIIDNTTDKSQPSMFLGQQQTQFLSQFDSAADNSNGDNIDSSSVYGNESQVMSSKPTPTSTTVDFSTLTNLSSEEKAIAKEYNAELSQIYSKGRHWLLERGWIPGKGLGNEPLKNIAKPIDCLIMPARYGLGNNFENDMDDDDDD